MHSERFSKLDRLRKRDEFARVHRSKLFAADHVLVISAVANQLDRTRLGLSVSKKTGNAVVRNRWKRAIREAFRRQKHNFPAGLDLVVRPRKGAEFDGQEISRSLNSLMKRLGRKVSR